MGLPWGGGTTVGRGIFGAGSGFRVGWRIAGVGGAWSLFRGFSASIGGVLILAGVMRAGLSFNGV